MIYLYKIFISLSMVADANTREARQDTLVNSNPNNILVPRGKVGDTIYHLRKKFQKPLEWIEQNPWTTLCLCWLGPHVVIWLIKELWARRPVSNAINDKTKYLTMIKLKKDDLMDQNNKSLATDVFEFTTDQRCGIVALLNDIWKVDQNISYARNILKTDPKTQPVSELEKLLKSVQYARVELLLKLDTYTTQPRLKDVETVRNLVQSKISNNDSQDKKDILQTCLNMCQNVITLYGNHSLLRNDLIKSLDQHITQIKTLITEKMREYEMEILTSKRADAVINGIEIGVARLLETQKEAINKTNT